ncbi:hypothetical protein [Helicobacter sp. 11S03491-1]|uniref:hypothetical protein n=1 Tax=Helicobacter sp. 11S03491-1 TaxID=1476196 RepID=UPI000BA7DA46|nr:hypothetical protein [Helicobacter sp. 11S03491-1]PAF41327.1 hypothetical protein BKH45_07420 [Helicobacter sp. 11S03491-1]
MNIQNNSTDLKDIFSQSYHRNVLSPSLPQNNSHSEVSLLENNFHKPIEDSFVPSKEYTKIIELQDQIKGGFKDVNSFVVISEKLHKEGILNNDDMIAVDFLAKESPKPDFDEFNKIMQNDYLSLEMKGLISRLVQKLEMIDYLSKGAMSA